ncbi:sugar transferase [bacterium]|nr:sugar transferase [bacterium]
MASERKFWLKYLVDKLLALLFSPVLLLTSLVAWALQQIEGWLEPRARGPLFYSEVRWTQGRPFRIYKFRTTYPGTQDPGTVGEVTRTGHFLKKYYLDELPQLFNILRGDMTWVGPRPTHPERAQAEIEQEGMRSKLILRAGLTGLVQVQKPVAQNRAVYSSLEEEYLAEISRLGPVGVLLHDLELIWRTVPVVFKGEGL